MTMDVTGGAGYSSRLADLDRYTTTSAADSTRSAKQADVDDRGAAGPQTLGTAHHTTATALTQQDFDVVVRFSAPAVSTPPPQPDTSTARVDPTPERGADRAASNPYGNLIGSLRMEALRRDAAAGGSAAAPKDRTPTEPER